MQIIRVSRYAVIVYGVFMGVLAIILQEIGLSLGWVCSLCMAHVCLLYLIYRCWHVNKVDHM